MYKNEIMQYLSNHPKMTSVVDQLTPSHPSLYNIVSCPDLLWGKGLVTVEHLLVLGCAKETAVSILNKPMNSDTSNQNCFLGTTKKTIVTRHFSTLKYYLTLIFSEVRCKECREISDQRTQHSYLQLYVGVSKQLSLCYYLHTLCHSFFSNRRDVQYMCKISCCNE